MAKKKFYSVCWIRFAPYMIPWIVATFGTDVQYGGSTLVDISPIQGVDELLSRPYHINAGAQVTNDRSFSDQLMRILRAAKNLPADIVNQDFSISDKILQECLPVEVPDIVRSSGLNRRWSPVVQVASTVAYHIDEAVRELYWTQMIRHEANCKKRAAIEGRTITGEEFVDNWCERYGISKVYAETIGRMYRRNKKRFVKNI
ncbi:MAG: hypothetical protein K6C30_03750 [Bacteroidaceae bacterium]|nr:hypothetical protein [Bacteroidaceae bacterium]